MDSGHINQLLNILSKGIVLIDGTPVYSIFYFIYLKKIVNLLIGIKKKEGLTFHDKMALEENIEPRILDDIYKEAFRVASSCTNMKEFFVKYKICRTDRIKDMKYVPFIYRQCAF